MGEPVFFNPTPLLKIRDGSASDKDARYINFVTMRLTQQRLEWMKRPGYTPYDFIDATSTGSHIGGVIPVYIETNTSTSIITFILPTGTNTKVEILESTVPKFNFVSLLPLTISF